MLQRTTLRQQAYEAIRNKVSSGELAGGTPLSEPALAKELGMSRTPLREAIRQMEMEGLLEYAPRFGTVVRVPDAKALEEMYIVREALEACAAEEAARRISGRQIERLKARLREMADVVTAFRSSGEANLEDGLLRQFMAADLEFHKVIIRASENKLIAKILDSTGLLLRAFLFTHWHYDAEGLKVANAFHEELLNALESRDGEAARRSTISAVRVAREAAMQAMEKG